MPRTPRKLILENGSFFHVTWKCHNNDFLLRDETVKKVLYNLLVKYKTKHGIEVFGYCFMDNHPHLVGRCKSIEEFSRFFQTVNGQLARFINKIMGRSGQVVKDRFKSCQIETDRHLLAAIRYNDLNPVRAGICQRARNFRWSSCRSRSLDLHDALLDPLPEGLGITAQGYEELTESEFRRLVIAQNLPFFNKRFFFGTPEWVKRKKREVFDFYMEKKQRGTGR